jgi:hypothetical protein
MGNQTVSRPGRRWGGWVESPLEDRRLMSVGPGTTEVLPQHLAPVPAEAGHGSRHGHPHEAQAGAGHRHAQGTTLHGSQATYLRIANWSHVRIRLGISDVDSYDYDGVDRPDHNLQGVVLQPGESVERREEINTRAKYPAFTLTLYRDGTGEAIGSVRSYFGLSGQKHSRKPIWELSPESNTFRFYDGIRPEAVVLASGGAPSYNGSYTIQTVRRE